MAWLFNRCLGIFLFWVCNPLTIRPGWELAWLSNRCWCTVVPSNLNQPKISLLYVISRNFPDKFQEIYLIFVSGHCMHFLFKIRQSVAGISITKAYSPRYLFCVFFFDCWFKRKRYPSATDFLSNTCFSMQILSVLVH